MTVTFSPRAIVGAFAVIVLALLAAYAATQFLLLAGGHDTQWGLRRLFDLNEENNIPSWYSASSLLICSLLLVVIARSRKAVGDRWTGYWFALSAIVLFFSIDEAASIHELAIEPVRARLHPTGYLYHAWVIPGAFVIAAVGLALVRFVRNLPPGTRRWFSWAAVVYVTGAFGGELLSGEYWYVYGGAASLSNSLHVAFEEGLEMAGVLIFLYGLCVHLQTHLPDVCAGIEPRA